MSNGTRKFLSPPLIGISLVVISLAYLLGWSPLLSVTKLQIQGAPTATIEKSIAQMSQIEVGEKLARVNPQSIERKIGKISWVRQVAIKRDWIDGAVTITLTPRQPLAFFNSDQISGQTIDEYGVLFSLPGYTNPDLAVISAKSPESALKANELFTALPENFRRQITSMVATSSNTFTLNSTLDGREIRIRWGDSQDLSLKISAINSLLQLPENKRITLIDVVSPYAPIVK